MIADNIVVNQAYFSDMLRPGGVDRRGQLRRSGMVEANAQLDRKTSGLPTLVACYNQTDSNKAKIYSTVIEENPEPLYRVSIETKDPSAHLSACGVVVGFLGLFSYLFQFSHRWNLLAG
jgi:hypothetical protein